MDVRVGLLSCLVVVGAAAAPARAGEGAAGFARGTVDRARRAVSFGPFVGAGVAGASGAGDSFDVLVTFGLGLVLFKIPVVPTAKEVEALIAGRVKARVAERVKAMVTAGQPAPDEQELARIGAEILAEVKDEILRRRPYAGRTLERPRLAVALEGGYGLVADRQRLGLTIGVGVSRVTVGPTLAVGFTDGFGDADLLHLGGELGVHLTPRPRARSHVIDVYLRVETDVAGDESSTRVDLGARALLDLI
jgi:hypothetical protein